MFNRAKPGKTIAAEDLSPEEFRAFKLDQRKKAHDVALKVEEKNRRKKENEWAHAKYGP
jgi:hypothetical protein